MMMRNFISQSFESEQPSAGSYLAITGVVLFTSVLTIPNAQARRIAPVEVVVYEGDPIDYSNQDDVIVLEEASSQNGYTNVILVQDFTDDSSSQSKTVANLSSPSSQPQMLSNARPTQQPKVQPTQPKATPHAVKSLDSIAQNEQSQPNRTLVPNAEGKDPELVAFYVGVFGKQQSNLSEGYTPPTTLAVKQTLTKNVVHKKTNPSKVQLSKTTSKDKELQSVQNEILIANADGKDPELVAFYMDVFGKQKNKLSKQSPPSTILAVKQTLAKKVVQKKSKPKSKPNKFQLAKTTSKGKDPELVAFYEQVFGNDKSSSSKHVPAVVTSKTKDPELVAFYEREFGKSISKTKVAVLTKNVSNKVKITSNSKSDQKRSVKKVKEKTKNSISTAAVELQKLIDDLTSKNII